MSLLDETGLSRLRRGKGMALAVTGFDGLDENGEVLRWQVSCQRGEGYIAAANVRMTEDEALPSTMRSCISSTPPAATAGRRRCSGAGLLPCGEGGHRGQRHAR